VPDGVEDNHSVYAATMNPNLEKKMPIPLIPAFEALDESSLHDVMLMFARNIEDAMIDSGAVPGEDYSRLDLFKLAEPYVRDWFKAGNLSYTKSWKI
jgi:hypothetical protein